jgi:hypothetical protein
MHALVTVGIKIMNWTTQKPATSGWYWWRETGHSKCLIVQVDTEAGTVGSSGTDEYRLLKEIVEGEWFGPLEMPK